MNHASIGTKKTLFLISTVESAMVAAPSTLTSLRRRSLDSCTTSSDLAVEGSVDSNDSQQHQQQRQSKPKMGGFGALLRRVGGSQGHMEEQDDHNQQQEQHQPMGSQSERGLGGLLRRAKSLRGNIERERGNLERSNSDSAAARRRRLDLEEKKEEVYDDGPSGVASFLQQIDPGSADDPQHKAAESAQEEAPTKRASAPATVEGEHARKQIGGGAMIRGLIKRAASFRSNRDTAKPAKKEEPSPQEQQQQLEPVLVLTDGNHGKVVFQNLDMVDPAFSSSESHASLPDLAMSSSGRSPSDSPNCKMNNSFHTARTSVTARDSTLDDQYFLDFSDRDMEELRSSEEEVQEEQHDVNYQDENGRSSLSSLKDDDCSGAASTIREQMAGLFRRTKSGRIIIGGSSSASSEGGTDTTTTDDSSGDCSEDEEGLNTTKQNGPTTSSSAPSSPTSLQEITLPSLEEDDEEEDDSEPYVEGLLETVDECDDYEKGTCCSTSSNSLESEDLDVYEESPPSGFVGEDQQPQKPAREYDELELFYEEQTFEHVGGSLLLGAQSELMTVPEYDEEDYDSEEECEEGEEEDEEQDEYNQGEPTSFLQSSSGSLMLSSNLLTIVEEDGMDESFNTHDSTFSA